METILVKSNNVLILPTRFSRKYGIRLGVKIFLVEEKDHIKIFPRSKEVIDINIGFLGKKGSLLKALKKEKRKERVL